MKGFFRRLESLRYALSLFGLPVLVACFAVVGMVILDAPPVESGVVLPIRTLVETGSRLDPASALQQVRVQKEASHVDTRRSELPFWFSVSLKSPGTVEPTEIEFTSRHTRSLTCWRADDLRWLGEADRTITSGAMRTAKGGFALGLPLLSQPAEILCRSVNRGPARIATVQWIASALDRSIAEFHRRNGLLEGGLLTLALFIFITALINKEWIYVLFAAWLVANLRLGLISTGWDVHWLGLPIPLDWNEEIRKVTIPIYYILTFALFGELFKTELKRLGKLALLSVAHWLGLLLLVISLTQPVLRFLPMMWVIVAFGIAVLVAYLGRVLVHTRSRVALWYTASLAVVMLSSMSEVVGAAFGLKTILSSFNSVSAALFSSLIAAIAIAEQLRSERTERRIAEADLRHVYDSTPVGLFTLDRDGVCLRANPAMERILGRRLLPGEQVCWDDYFGNESSARLRDVAAENADLEFSPKSGVLRGKSFLAKASLVADRIEGSLQDVTERALALRQLVFLAEHDALTGISNRRAIEAVLERAIGQRSGGKAGPAVALAYLDLDRFKLINDLFGHQAGDEVLKQVSRRVIARLGKDQHFGRVGGDEFVIVFEDTPIAQANSICKRVIAAIGDESIQVGNRAFQINVSIGLIEVAPNLTNAEAISSADRACREAKKSMHDHLIVYELNAPAFQDRAEELRLIDELGGPHANFRNLFLEMQPIMSLHAPHETKDFEVLLRVRGPDGGIIPAWRVIPIAEQHGFIAKIDQWVLKTTLVWIEQNLARLGNTNFVCVNLSGGSLNDERFINETFALLAEHKEVLSLLCIEVTESIALHDLENSVRFVDGLRLLGAKVALDDFGAGYTSFSYLKVLSADAIKIDGSFIKNMSAHPADISIVAAIVELARNLGMKSIAEWVEDQATLELLADIGVDYVQGYLLARPQLPEAISAADSAASFIQESATADFVRKLPLRPERLDAFDDLIPVPGKMVH